MDFTGFSFCKISSTKSQNPWWLEVVTDKVDCWAPEWFPPWYTWICAIAGKARKANNTMKNFLIMNCILIICKDTNFMPQKICRRNKVSCRCGKRYDLGTDWIRTIQSFALDRHCYATNITTTPASGVSVRPQRLQPSAASCGELSSPPVFCSFPPPQTADASLTRFASSNHRFARDKVNEFVYSHVTFGWF